MYAQFEPAGTCGPTQWRQICGRKHHQVDAWLKPLSGQLLASTHSETGSRHREDTYRGRGIDDRQVIAKLKSPTNASSTDGQEQDPALNLRREGRTQSDQQPPPLSLDQSCQSQHCNLSESSSDVSTLQMRKVRLREELTWVTRLTGSRGIQASCSESRTPLYPHATHSPNVSLSWKAVPIPPCWAAPEHICCVWERQSPELGPQQSKALPPAGQEPLTCPRKTFSNRVARLQESGLSLLLLPPTSMFCN